MREMDNKTAIFLIATGVVVLTSFALGVLFAKDNVINYTEGVNLTSISEWVAEPARTPEDFNALLAEIENAIK